jgi:N-methylhydantoinase B/oxoprolinase/acetone carboxylase alpha subunit
MWAIYKRSTSLASGHQYIFHNNELVGNLVVHDDPWLTKIWGLKGGKPGQRSLQIAISVLLVQGKPPTDIVPSKSDHVRVHPGDLPESMTSGGGVEVIR